MYYVIRGEEKVFRNTFSYYFEGSFTNEELENKAKELYASEYEIDLNVSIITRKSDGWMEPFEEFDFSFSCAYKSDAPISDV